MRQEVTPWQLAVCLVMTGIVFFVIGFAVGHTTLDNGQIKRIEAIVCPGEGPNHPGVLYAPNWVKYESNAGSCSVEFVYRGELDYVAVREIVTRPDEVGSERWQSFQEFDKPTTIRSAP